MMDPDFVVYCDGRLYRETVASAWACNRCETSQDPAKLGGLACGMGFPRAFWSGKSNGWWLLDEKKLVYRKYDNVLTRAATVLVQTRLTLRALTRMYRRYVTDRLIGRVV